MSHSNECKGVSAKILSQNFHWTKYSHKLEFVIVWFVTVRLEMRVWTLNKPAAENAVQVCPCSGAGFETKIMLDWNCDLSPILQSVYISHLLLKKLQLLVIVSDYLAFALDLLILFLDLLVLVMELYEWKLRNSI